MSRHHAAQTDKKCQPDTSCHRLQSHSPRCVLRSHRRRCPGSPWNHLQSHVIRCPEVFAVAERRMIPLGKLLRYRTCLQTPWQGWSGPMGQEESPKRCPSCQRVPLVLLSLAGGIFKARVGCLCRSTVFGAPSGELNEVTLSGCGAEPRVRTQASASLMEETHPRGGAPRLLHFLNLSAWNFPPTT